MKSWEANMEQKTTIIQHPKHGRVEGVERITEHSITVQGKYSVVVIDGPAWQKDGQLYLYAWEWREVPSKRDVTADVVLKKDKEGKTSFLLCLNHADRDAQCTFTKVQAVVLPEGMSWYDFWLKFWANKNTDESPEHICERMASTVIQVWQEGK